MRKWGGLQSAAFLVALFACFNVQARHLGVLGPTYPIHERNLIEVMQEKMAEKQANGEIAAMHERMADQAAQYVQRPPGQKLPRALERKISSFSPLYVLDRDIHDATGKLIFAKGTTVNPLKIKPLTKMLCFIDGDDPQQVEWMMKSCAYHPANKLILVAGNYQTLMTQLNVRLYFDQQGWLVNKFHIQALPAVVKQQGQDLYVEEIPVL